MSKDNEHTTGEQQWTWCLVGNVKMEYVWGEEKIVRRGSKLFPPGAKLYCFPSQWGDGYENIMVIGKPRRTGRLITIIMRSERIENWRVKKVYDKRVLERMKGKTWADRFCDEEIIRRFAESLNKKPHGKQEQ
jgi:hypothetical protein